MGDLESVKYIASLGVGGALCALMMSFYRKDVKQYTELWRGQSEMLMTVVKENTISNTKMIALLDALHKRMDSGNGHHS